MKKHFAAFVAAILLLGAVPALAPAQIAWATDLTLVPKQNFDAPIVPGGLVDQGGWNITGTSTTNPVQVVSGNLTYADGGLPASAGNSVAMVDAGQDVGIPFTSNDTPTTVTPGDGNTYYYSLLFRHDGSDIGSTAGDYIAHFTAGIAGGGTAFRGRLFLADNGSGQMVPGIRYGSASTIVYGTNTIPANTTVFLVVKLTEVAGTDNDTAEVFLIASGPVPATEPGTADAISVGNGGSDQDIAIIVNGGLGRFGLRQGTAASAPSGITVDEIRVGTSWAAVTTDPTSSVGDWHLMN